MAKNKEEKTNVIRLLEGAGIPCSHLEVPLAKDQVPDGVTAARLIGKPVEQVFKTLVAESPKGEHFVFVIPVAETLDLKKAARAAGV
ncbi:MAG: Cys-tRNA(Pro) deacylase, partial [Oscillospiraceae bacterium]|nr:Cys-tRNA(Pro) deacylase [Oscillospiraceae bacterium]